MSSAYGAAILATLVGASATSVAAWMARRQERKRALPPSVAQVSLEERIDELSE
jgi:hypothetical protein